MSWRKLLVRGLVFSVIGGCIAVVLLYQRWTDPAVVRAQVIAKLQELFPGANISLDSARLHLFGGIVLSELRLTRRDDPEQLEFAHIPTAVLYHDKEHLLDGQFSFRKVVLTQPRVRVQRGRDGRWNLEGLTSVQPSAGAHPTVVVEQGTLILEDCLAHPGMPPVEINDVNLTLLNDPPEIINIEGSGTSEIAGMLQLRGSWERQSHAASFSVQVAGLRLTPLLVQRAAAYCRDRTLAALHLDGLADLKAELDYQPGSGRPFSYDIQGSIRAGKVRHPRLPLPWENLQASARCTNGHLTVDHLTADSGATRLELLKGAAQLPNIDQDCEIAVTVHHLPLDGNLCACLPEGMQNLFRDFQPSGPASVTAHVVRQAGQWHRQQYTLAPEGIRVCYRHFKYPAENITGSVKYDALKQLTEVDVKGYSGPQPLTLTGFWNGYNLDADARLEITATGIPLDEKLIKALPEPLKTTALSFHAVGRADGRALIVHTPNVEGVQCTYHVRFFDTSVRWNYFPLLLENITGCLDVYPTHWELRDCRGTHNGGEVFVRGGSVPPAGGARDEGRGAREENAGPLASALAPRPSPLAPPSEGHLLLDISGKDIPLDGDLKKALQAKMEGLAKAWDTFAPRGRLNFAAHIDRVPGKDDDLDVAIDVRGCAIEPTFFRYALDDLTGHFRYHKDRLQLTRVTARHNHTRLSLADGTVDFYRNGAFYAELNDLIGNPVLPDADLRTALPESMRSACQSLELRDPFAFQTRLIISQGVDPNAPPDIYWNGRAWLHQAKLQLGVDVSDITGEIGCLGRHNGRQFLGVLGNVLLERATVFNQPFHDVHARLQVTEKEPEVLVVGLGAPIFGGEVSGQARLDFHSDLKYELNLTGSQIQLEEASRHNFAGASQMNGIAAARLYLSGKGSDPATLAGDGSIDIPYTPSTRLYNLPGLLHLLNFLGLRWPDRTAFEEAHAVFSIRGDRVDIARLDLLGNVISLWGRGDVKLDGTDVKLDFYPSWARVEQILPPVIRSIPPAISKNLMKIEVRGKVSGNAEDLKFHKKPVPGLMDPLMSVRDMVVGKRE